YENTFCRQLGWLMSGQLLWLNEGAPSSLLLSPVNTNVSCSTLDEGVVAPYPSIPEGRTIDHGIATSFSPPWDVELVEAEVVDDADGVVDSGVEGDVADGVEGVVEDVADGDDGVVEEVDGVVELVLVPDVDADGLNEITAKS